MFIWQFLPAISYSLVTWFDEREFFLSVWQWFFLTCFYHPYFLMHLLNSNLWSTVGCLSCSFHFHIQCPLNACSHQFSLLYETGINFNHYINSPSIRIHVVNKQKENNLYLLKITSRNVVSYNFENKCKVLHSSHRIHSKWSTYKHDYWAN